MAGQNVVVGSNFLWRDLGRFGIQALTEHMLVAGNDIAWYTTSLSLLHVAVSRTRRAKAEYLRIALGSPRIERTDDAILVNRVPLCLAHPVPNRPPLDSVWLSRHYLSLTVPQLPALARRDGIDPVDLLFFDAGGINVYYPFRKRARAISYRVNDLVAEFPNQVRGRIKSEREIIKQADVLLPVSQPIYDTVVDIRGSDTGVHLLPNGFDLDVFDASYDPPVEYATMPGPIAVLVGQLNTWYDLDLLAQVALSRPKVSFVLVGPGRVPDGLPANMHALGLRPHDQIPAYLQHADVGLMPFKDIPRVYKCDSIKFYEYCASGLPIVCHPNLALLDRVPDHAFGASSPEQFAEGIDSALALGAEDRAALKSRARAFSWDTVYAQFDAIMTREGIDIA